MPNNRPPSNDDIAAGGCPDCDDGSTAARLIQARSYAFIVGTVAVATTALIFTLTLLAFFYPQQASQWLTLYVVPALAIFGFLGTRARAMYVKMLGKR